MIPPNAENVKIEVNAVSAIKFLKVLRPEGPWALTAIRGSKIVVEEFTGQEAAKGFITQYNNDAFNLYYGLNPTKRPLNSKASKEDIASVRHLHVDIDPQ